MKKKTRTSKAAKSMRDLPEKAVSAKTAKNVKGGVSFTYGTFKPEYKPQKPDGSLDAGIHFKYDLKANKIG